VRRGVRAGAGEIPGGLALTNGGAPAATGGLGAGLAVPAPAAATGARPVTVTVGDSMQFSPPSIVVLAGQPVELTLRNGGYVPGNSPHRPEKTR
jgi:hypothetical protein